ncbi:MAG: phosphosulfolactate synthase, partial [Betaproteobacteria bacterium]
MSKAPFSFVGLPDARSQKKPRLNGRTMVVDDGMPLGATRDLLELGGAYIDLAKIKTGTARFYPRKQLTAKLRAYRKHQVQPFLGGQFHEFI